MIISSDPPSNPIEVEVGGGMLSSHFTDENNEGKKIFMTSLQRW